MVRRELRLFNLQLESPAPSSVTYYTDSPFQFKTELAIKTIDLCYRTQLMGRSKAAVFK